MKAKLLSARVLLRASCWSWPSWRAWPAPRPTGLGRLGHQRLRLVLRRAGHAAVGGRCPDRRPQRQLPAQRLARRPAPRTPDGLIDFAGTEAEYSALGQDTSVSRGFQYVPDVAGAVAIMYHVQDKAGQKVDYLHLSRETIARIFMGYISNWDDPAITAENKGLVLPDKPINVVYRGGQSGTTGLFYDFIQHTVPDVFNAVGHEVPAARPNVRIIQLDGTPQFAPKTQAFNGSDQIAQHIASSGGLWSIAYDEFGYAKTYGAEAAWVQNASGAWVLPYAENISAALESATLRPDLSQELSGVYASTNPLAYPISAYSYLVTQCAPAADRATCKGPYTNPGVAATLSQWMRYIACDGQVSMASIGYSPLPPNLSQEIVNSIGRMLGKPPETLTAANCNNPRFWRQPRHRRGRLSRTRSSRCLRTPSPTAGPSSARAGRARLATRRGSVAAGPRAARRAGAREGREHRRVAGLVRQRHVPSTGAAGWPKRPVWPGKASAVGGGSTESRAAARGLRPAAADVELHADPAVLARARHPPRVHRWRLRSRPTHRQGRGRPPEPPLTASVRSPVTAGSPRGG